MNKIITRTCVPEKENAPNLDCFQGLFMIENRASRKHFSPPQRKLGKVPRIEKIEDTGTGCVIEKQKLDEKIKEKSSMPHRRDPQTAFFHLFPGPWHNGP